MCLAAEAEIVAISVRQFIEQKLCAETPCGISSENIYHMEDKHQTSPQILDLSTEFFVHIKRLQLSSPNHSFIFLFDNPPSLRSLSSGMASEGSPQDLQSFLERLLSSEFRSGPLPFPFLAGLRFAVPSQEPDPEEDGPQMPARFILINPFTQSMAVFERAGTDSNSLFDELFSEKRGRPPASKASIDAMKSIEVSEGEPFDDQCAICLEDWEVGETAKEMPCSHRFHSKCIHKWLTIHGSCPVCRYEMPIEEEEGEKKRSGESGGPRRRGVWISLVVSGDRRNGEENEEGSDHTLNDSESQNQAVQ